MNKGIEPILLMHGWHNEVFSLTFMSLKERIQEIQRDKPVLEQALRLRLIREVQADKIPCRDSEEWQAYDRQAYVQAYEQAYEQARQAWQAYEQARQAYEQAWQAYVQARQAYKTKFAPELEAYHKEFCPDCPWDEDKETIFTRKDEKGNWY